ncbi:hypothetical protein Leryth_017379 [Lithospermum erythrorhizon]|nr:hypothetical protein Leryth_017379 [Lithospermum erythrorhizon]
MEENSIASNVARAIAAALDWSSSSDARKAAYDFLESVKAGDVRVLANTSFLLVKKDWSSEIRLHAFKMLQHLVRLRWDELNPGERRDFAKVAVDLMPEVAGSHEEWVLKSQTAALIAEIIRREGLNLWQELLPTLVSLSNNGPIHAEVVAMVLRWLPEDITVHNEDLEGDRRRLLLRGLTQSLPEVFSLLYTLLERHFRDAVAEASRQQLDLAKQHAAAITATLNAINAYVEWAPMSDLANCGIIHGCGFLLSSPDFRLHACELFKLVSSRRRPSDAASEFDSAMRLIFQILMGVARDYLQKSSSSGVDENDSEFAECICESMSALGSSNLHCITADGTVLYYYLEQMLGFFQHFKLSLHYHSLLFWVAFMRDLVSKPKICASGEQAGQENIEKSKLLASVNGDVCNAILDTSFIRILKKEKIHGTKMSIGNLELWSDDFEGKGEFSHYRSRLLDLIRLVTSHNPLVAAENVCKRTIAIIQNPILASEPAQELAIVESMQLALESVVAIVFDASSGLSGSPDVQQSLCGTFEGLLQQLLRLQWTEPALVEILGHYLVALGPFLKYYPAAAGDVINKLFELLNSLPSVIKDPATSRARHARLQICTSFIRVAKNADNALLPHMKGIADTTAYLQKEGRLLRAEHNIMGEAFLVMASAAGVQQQHEVLAWLLEPLSVQWILTDWQDRYLSDPSGFVRLCSETRFMWSLFHTVTFFEKALKRSKVRKNNISSQNTPTTNATVIHPMASHLSWMLPPLLKLLRAIHSLWSPPTYQALPGEMKAAMVMSDVERTSLLGEANLKQPKSSLSFTDAPQFDMSNDSYSEPNETDVRNWLKGIRDSGYNVLGLSTTIGDIFFTCLNSDSVASALMENINSMEFRHLKQLIHLVLIPLIKSCPSNLWGIWLDKLLQPLLAHLQQALSCSWSSLLQEGRAMVPDQLGILSGSDLKVEVMEEKLLRDLTRETCSLLSVASSVGVMPSIEQSGHLSRVDESSLVDIGAFASSSMVGFILGRRGIAVPVLQIALGTLQWTDGEAVTKISSFCSAVILLTTSINNVELRQFVGKDLFSAVIQGLTLESNAIISADLIELCREIIIYLSDKDPGPRQVLLSLPSITPQDLLAFEQALAKTSSPKEQKQLTRSFLLLATGNKLKALASQKSINIITNMSTKPRDVAVPAGGTIVDEGDSIGLAAIL